MTLRLIPPIAVPQSVPEVMGALVGRDASADFSDGVREATGTTRIAWFPSGRAALADRLSRAAPTGVVALPAYTCWTLAAAAVRVGWKVRPVDVDPRTLDFDPDGLRAALAEGVNALVSVHLLGARADLAGHAALIRESPERPEWIEDAAQRWPTPPTPADAVLLSFGRGKPVPLGGGGAWLDRGNEDAGHPPEDRGWSRAAAFAATSWLGRATWYRLPASIPALGLGKTTFEPRFPREGGLHRWQFRLGARALSRLPEWRERRAAHARALVRALDDLAGLERPAIDPGDGPARLPLYAPSREARAALVRRLRRAGVSASGMYPGTLGDVLPLAPQRVGRPRTPGAETVRDRLWTLPVYPTLSERARETVVRSVRDAWREVCR